MSTSDQFILPSSLVQLTVKIANIYDISSYNLFSALDTLEYALKLNYESLPSNQNDLNGMTILIINILRLAEKFNCATSMLTKPKIAQAFADLPIDYNQCNAKELEHFKSFNMDVKTPQIVELIYDLIDRHMKEECVMSKRDNILNTSMDILKVFYNWRAQLYEATQRTDDALCKELASESKLVAISIVFIVLNVLNFAGRIVSSIFDSMCSELQNGKGAKEVNHLSSIIFAIIKKK